MLNQNPAHIRQIRHTPNAIQTCVDICASPHLHNGTPLCRMVNVRLRNAHGVCRNMGCPHAFPQLYCITCNNAEPQTPCLDELCLCAFLHPSVYGLDNAVGLRIAGLWLSHRDTKLGRNCCNCLASMGKHHAYYAPSHSAFGLHARRLMIRQNRPAAPKSYARENQKPRNIPCKPPRPCTQSTSGIPCGHQLANPNEFELHLHAVIDVTLPKTVPQ